MGDLLGQQLAQPPQDGISNLRFATTGDLLLASSWDGLARLYDARQNLLRGTYAHQAPLLDATFQDQSIIFTGGLDGLVKRYDFFGHAEQVIGQHSAPIRTVEFLRETGLIATGSWDSSARLWDPRAPPGQNCACIIGLPGKVFTMAQSQSRLVIGTSGRHVMIYDIRSIRTGQPEQARESSLKFQTRCIRCYPNGTGYALSSVEGRVAVEYFDNSDAVQQRKYAFKCHRRKEGDRDVVFPVNSIAFNLQHGTFATGGCDGIVNMWDGENKKRLFQSPKYPTSIAAMAFNSEATYLAVASSYTHEQGDRDHPPDAIYLHPVTESEIRPKPRK